MVKVQHFFDPLTFTLTYIVYDPTTYDAVIIDPVLDFEYASGKISQHQLNIVIKFIQENKLHLHAVLETHAHADHISSSQYIKEKILDAKICIGHKITEVQKVFKTVFNLKNLLTDGSQFDQLLLEQKVYHFGSLQMTALATPGHTPACMSYLFNQKILFVGDALFMPDYGTGRCDFPGGSAKKLYDSIHEVIYKLPDETIIYTGHDYLPNGRNLQYQTTVGQSKQNNIQLNALTSEAKFIQLRESRDRTLDAPKLLLPSIQVNIAAGKLPQPEDNGTIYLKLPVSKIS